MARTVITVDRRHQSGRFPPERSGWHANPRPAASLTPIDADPHGAGPVVVNTQHCRYKRDAIALKDRMKHDSDRALVYRLSKQLGRRESLRTRPETAGAFIGAVAVSFGFESERQR